MRYARLFFLLVILFCVLETIRLWFLSPGVMASHFNAQGLADHFVPKLDFFGFQIQTAIVVIVLGFVTQLLFMVLPAQWVNMPNREYWLTPERREATMERIGSLGAGLFGIILLVIQAGFELSVSANMHKPIVFAAQIMVLLLVGFIIVSFMMLFWLIRSFRLPP